MQEYHLRATGTLPEVGDLETWLRRGGRAIIDGDDEDDNVVHTGDRFICLDAYGAIEAVDRALQIRLLESEGRLRVPLP